MALSISAMRSSLNSSTMMEGLVDMKYWPILHGNKWEESTFDLTWLLGMGRKKFAIDVFFSMYVYADAKDTNVNLLYVRQTFPRLGRGNVIFRVQEYFFLREGTQKVSRVLQCLLYNPPPFVAENANVFLAANLQSATTGKA